MDAAVRGDDPLAVVSPPLPVEVGDRPAGLPDQVDTVAGVHLVRAGGGTVTDLQGERRRPDSEGLVASTGRVHDVLLAAARATGGG